MLRFEVLTLFPELFRPLLQEGLLARATERQVLSVELNPFRRFGLGKHLQVDDEPYGGGPGMLLRPEPIWAALEDARTRHEAAGRTLHRILLTPQGRRFDQAKALELSQRDEVLVLICGRYEGFDERIRSFVDEEISGGDFITLGGETIALTMLEAVGRLVPGVLGNQSSSEQESFSEPLLEFPQYTRPAEFQGQAVPEVLLSGNHQNIAQWRQEQAVKRTQERRPDLLQPQQ
jgi:tRNA (guanine37-N1)-methyltransferase